METTQQETRETLLAKADLLSNNEVAQQEIATQLEALSGSEVVQSFTEWEMFEDYQTLASQDKYTFRSRKSNGGVRFRDFSKAFVTELELDEQVGELAEEFHKQNTSSPVTFRKQDVRRELEQELDRKPTAVEVQKAGIRRLIELIVLTTITDCYRANQGDTSVLQHRLQVFAQQDERYTLRLLQKHFPDLIEEDISTLSWSVPYKWHKQILQTLS